MFPDGDSRGASHADQIGEIPLREISGLALRERGTQVLAVGDHDFALAVGTLRRGGVDTFNVVNLGHALRKAGIEQQSTSQWEGVRSDASGRVFVLEENPGHIFVFDEAGERLLASIELAFHTMDPDLFKLQKAWHANPNSRSEGFVLLERGHVLVLKEKQPRRLIEFGPEDERPVGFRPIGSATAFTLPRASLSVMVPLRVWKFSKDSKMSFADCSDMDVDRDGRLWITSDEGHVIGRVTRPRHDAPLDIDSITRLPDKSQLTKPEGLALASRTHALIACDKPGRNAPLFSVQLNESSSVAPSPVRIS